MAKIQFRQYSTSLPPSTEPLPGGCICTKAAFDILDYCDKHGLDRMKATRIDDDGILILKDNCLDFKMTVNEAEKERLSLEMFTNPEVYDNPSRLSDIKKQIAKL